VMQRNVIKIPNKQHFNYRISHAYAYLNTDTLINAGTDTTNVHLMILENFGQFQK